MTINRRGGDLGTPCAVRHLLDHAYEGELGPVCRDGYPPRTWVHGRWWCARRDFLLATAESITTRHLVEDIARRDYAWREWGAGMHFTRIAGARVCTVAAPLVDSDGATGFVSPVLVSDGLSRAASRFGDRPPLWVQHGAARVLEFCTALEVGHVDAWRREAVRGWWQGDPAILVAPVAFKDGDLEDAREELALAEDAALVSLAERERLDESTWRSS